MSHPHVERAAASSVWRKIWALLSAVAMLVMLPVGAVTANAADATEQKYIKLEFVRTDSLGENVVVGSKLTYNLKITNVNATTAFVAYPTASNVDGIATAQSATNSAPVCRFSKVSPGATVNCTGTSSGGIPLAYHVVTQADKDAGGFTPTATVKATKNTDGTEEYETASVTGDKVVIKEPAPDPDPDVKDKLTVTTERTDTAGDNVAVGTKLSWKFTYKNNTSANLTVFPKMSNLSNTDVQSGTNVRWVDLKAGETKVVDDASKFAYHVVTAEDVIAGTFTPETLFQATGEREGTTVLQDNIVITGAPVTIKAPTPDDASTPTERKDGESIYLAKAQQFGNESYRIPALAEALNGWILAAWDLRPVGGDAPQPNSIVQRISKDGGKSWSTLTYVARGRNASYKYGYSDPSYVVDHETGDIFLFFVKSYDAGFTASQLGTDDARNVLQAVYVKSTDNGATWNDPVNITKEVTKGHETEWRSRFATSGAGIQLVNNTEHKGRLIQQYDILTTSGAQQAVSVYSDDHGKTWQVGNPVTATRMDENKVVELSNGDVMLNARPGAASYRKVAISKDGGVNYTLVKEQETQLPDPNNNAHIMRAYPNAPAGSAKAKILLYSGPRANNEGRANGVVRISFDDGTTWSSGKLYKENSMAYSVMTSLSAAAGGGYGLLYEGDWIHPAGVDSHQIMYTRFSLDWLGYMTATATGSAAVKQGTASVTVPVSVTNDGQTDYTEVTVTPDGLPTGWSAAPVKVDGGLAKGETKTVNVTVAVPAGAKSGDVATATLKLTGKYAQSSDTLKSFDEGKLTVTVTDPDPEPTVPTITGVAASTTQSGVKVGDSFDASAVKVVAQLSDGSTRVLAASEYELSAVDASGAVVDLSKPFAAAGVVKVTATVKGVDSLIASTFSISVAAKADEPGPDDTGSATKPGADTGKKPDLSKTGASVAGVAAAFMLLALAGGMAVVLRRRAA